MSVLLVVGVVVVVIAVLVGLVSWWDARLRRDHGEVSQTWRHIHGRDKGKGGSL